MRILGLRAKFGSQKRILLQEMDVKSVFQHVGIAPGGTVTFAYRLGDLIFVDSDYSSCGAGARGGGGGSEGNTRRSLGDDGRVHFVYCLGGEGVAYYVGKR